MPTFIDVDAVIEPERGERVLEIPQTDIDVMARLIGHRFELADAVTRECYGYPHWVTFDPVVHPGWGYGYLVVREGRLHRGPARWDST